MRWLRGRQAGLLVVAAVTVSVLALLVGRSVFLHPGSAVIGRNPSDDFQLMAWSLRFWPWAIAHGVAPWHTALLWAPSGFSTLWLTSIPGLSLVALPITLTAGPIVAYNVLVVAALVAAAVAAYLLCWELTEAAAPSVLGGLVFAFSPYLLGHAMSEHLNLLVVFPFPLFLLLGIRYLRGRISRRRFVALVAILLAFLVASSFELFVDSTLVCALTAIATACTAAGRRLLRQVVGAAALAYAVCLPLLAPIAVAGLLTQHAPIAHAPTSFSTDLLNLVVPTATALVGRLRWAERLSANFVGNVGERDGYLGVPLLAVVGAALWAQRRRLWPLGVLLVVALALSFGPVVAAEGRPLVVLPFGIDRLPVLDDLLPARFSIFVALAAAPLAAAWFARAGRGFARATGAALVVASLAPNAFPASMLSSAWATSREFAWSTDRLPEGFVADGRWAAVVPAGANLLVLPPGDRSAAQWWQTQSGMRFSLAVPETPFVPPQLAADPTTARLADNVLPQLDGTVLGAARLRAFLRARRIDGVVVTPSARASWLPVVRLATAARPDRLRDDLFFRVSPRLDPLRCRSTIPTRGIRPPFRAWLSFDGKRGHVWIRPNGRTAVELSHGDAESATAVEVRRGGAVAFIETARGHEDVAVARETAAGWQTTILDRNAAPIWSLRVAVTPGGTLLVAWIDEIGQQRRLIAAAAPPGGRWTKPAQLDVGDGLGTLAFIPVVTRSTALAWTDAVAGEHRLLTANYNRARGWSRPSVRRTSLEYIALSRAGHEALTRPRLSRRAREDSNLRPAD